jgi:hypothetical protein
MKRRQILPYRNITSKPLAVQPIPSCYTECAIPAVTIVVKSLDTFICGTVHKTCKVLDSLFWRLHIKKCLQQDESYTYLYKAVIYFLYISKEMHKKLWLLGYTTQLVNIRSVYHSEEQHTTLHQMIPRINIVIKHTFS